MKRRWLYIVMGLCLSLTSCELEMSDNGQLDGFWMLRTVETLNDGTVDDVHEQLISWAFQGRLMQARSAHKLEEVLFSFDHRGDSLHLFHPYFYHREIDDVPVLHAEDLHYVGIRKLNEGYKVLELSGSTMRLQSDQVRLTFKKY